MPDQRYMDRLQAAMNQRMPNNYRNNNEAQTNQQNNRDRFASFESFTYDLRGPNDQSRCIGGP